MTRPAAIVRRYKTREQVLGYLASHQGGGGLLHAVPDLRGMPCGCSIRPPQAFDLHPLEIARRACETRCPGDEASMFRT
jgi:hypothetical protein